MSENIYKRQVLGKFITEEDKIVEPLYFNGYISLDERTMIREYIEKLKEQLQQRDEVIEEAISFIENHSRKEPPYYEFLEFYNKANLSELLDILNKYKTEDKEDV